jgi:hypothetical protein
MALGGLFMKDIHRKIRKEFWNANYASVKEQWNTFHSFDKEFPSTSLLK